MEVVNRFCEEKTQPSPLAWGADAVALVAAKPPNDEVLEDPRKKSGCGGDGIYAHLECTRKRKRMWNTGAWEVEKHAGGIECTWN